MKIYQSKLFSLAIVFTLFAIFHPSKISAADGSWNGSDAVYTTGFEATIIDPESGAEFTSVFQITSGNGTLLFSTSSGDDSVFFITVNQSLFQNVQGYYDSQQVIVVLNASPTAKILRLKTGIYNFDGIQQPIIGGTVAIDSSEIVSNGDTPIAILHCDGLPLNSTGLWDSTSIQCGNDPAPCLSGEFGNGLASVPMSPVSESYGAVFEFIMPPFDLKTIDLDLKVSSTLTCKDLDGDGEVGSSDLAILLGAFNSETESYDFDNSGIVDSADLGILLGSYGLCDPNT